MLSVLRLLPVPRLGLRILRLPRLLRMLGIRVPLLFFMTRNTLGSVRRPILGSFVWQVVNCLIVMLESPSYPRLYIPNQIPRQTESNISPATLFLSGKMHEIVLDGTPDGKYQSFILPVLRLLILNV